MPARGNKTVFIRCQYQSDEWITRYLWSIFHPNDSRARNMPFASWASSSSDTDLTLMDLSYVCAITDASPYKSILCPMMWRPGSETDKVPPNTSPYGLRPLRITATEFVAAQTSHNLLWGWQNHTRMCIDAQVHDGARYPRLRVFIQDLLQCHAKPQIVSFAHISV